MVFLDQSNVHVPLFETDPFLLFFVANNWVAWEEHEKTPLTHDRCSMRVCAHAYLWYNIDEIEWNAQVSHIHIVQPNRSFL